MTVITLIMTYQVYLAKAVLRLDLDQVCDEKYQVSMICMSSRCHTKELCYHPESLCLNNGHCIKNMAYFEAKIFDY